MYVKILYALCTELAIKGITISSFSALPLSRSCAVTKHCQELVTSYSESSRVGCNVSSGNIRNTNSPMLLGASASINTQNATEPLLILMTIIGSSEMDAINNWSESMTRSMFQLNVVQWDHGALGKRLRGGTPSQ